MPRTKISEFSSTPANNTDIDSINIAEGCAPSGINDAIRELMSQLKDWQSGTSNDPYVVGSSGSLTLNQGTANGVAYLNGSKVVTSGSALTFDGTNLGIGTSSPSAPLDIQSNSGGTGIRVIGRASANAGAIRYFANDNTTQRARIESNDTGLEINSVANLPITFLTNDTERARIDSSGNFLVNTTTSTHSGISSKCILKSVDNVLGLVTDSGSTQAVRFTNGTTAVGSINLTTSTTAYSTTSDYRLKTVIGSVTGHGERIDALEPIEYEWKTDGSRTRGFLAHKFQEVYAGSVTGTKDAVDEQGNPVYQAMQASSSEVIADLVAEIKALRQRVAQLEAQ